MRRLRAPRWTRLLWAPLLKTQISLSVSHSLSPQVPTVALTVSGLRVAPSALPLHVAGTRTAETRAASFWPLCRTDRCLGAPPAPHPPVSNPPQNPRANPRASEWSLLEAPDVCGIIRDRKDGGLVQGRVSPPRPAPPAWRLPREAWLTQARS